MKMKVLDYSIKKRTILHTPFGRATQKAAWLLKEDLGIEANHPLQPILHEAATLALLNRLPINIDTIAFQVSRTPSLLARWELLRTGDKIGAQVKASLTDWTEMSAAVRV